MATRAELQKQLDTVEAQIAETQKQIDDPATDFEIRTALEGRLSLLQGRAQNIRQQMAMIGTALAVAKPRKTPKKKSKGAGKQ